MIQKFPSLLLLLLLIRLAGSSEAFAQIGREQALAAAYPGAEFRAERIFLTQSQRARISELAEVQLETALVARYLAVQDGQIVGRAYIDTHIVRTERESLLICLDEAGRVKRIEVTAFLEPPDYLAPRAWYDQYDGKVLDADLRLHRAIRPLAGATLTARAATDAVRRVLAIDQVVQEEARQ